MSWLNNGGHFEGEPKFVSIKTTHSEKPHRPTRQVLPFSLLDLSKVNHHDLTKEKPRATKQFPIEKKLSPSPKQKKSDSFEADDNENELTGKLAKIPTPRKSREIKLSVPHFELEMHKYGLLEKIKHIQQLSSHLGAELGSARNEEQSSIQDNSCSSITDRGGYAFPFQKRARSNSPPRGAAPFCKPGSPTAANPRKPVVVTKNFIIGAKKGREKMSHFGGKIELNEQQVRFLENEETYGLSTGPTDEEKKGELIGDEWMYQRIVEPEEDTIEGAVKEDDIFTKIAKDKEDDKGSFLQLLNTIQFDN